MPSRRRGTLLRHLGAAASLVLGLAFLVPSVALAARSAQATAYQLDPAHDGYQGSDAITAPLSQVWSTTLQGSISYPLIVNGVVYVTTISYTELGPVTSTHCTIDGKSTACSSIQAVLAQLSAGRHTFMVYALGATSRAYTGVSWTTVGPPAPGRLSAHLTKHGATLTWTASKTVQAYQLTVTIAKHSHAYTLRGSAHGMTLTLKARQRAAITLRAVGTNGVVGSAASLSVS